MNREVRLRLDVGEAFARLQLPNPRDARGREVRVENELLFFQIAILERDFANLELHTARLKRRHERSVFGLALFFFRAFHQHVSAVGMRHHRNLRGGRDVHVVANVAQPLKALRRRVVDVINHFVLCDRECGACRKEQDREEFCEAIHIYLGRCN